MKNRILFMHQASSVGGGSYCLLNILKAVDSANIDPVACLASDGPLRSEIEKLGIEVVIFPLMKAVPYNKSLLSISSIKTYYRVRCSIQSFQKLLAEKHIDVVYLNNMMIYPYLKPAKECGCKAIIHCREHWPLGEHTKQLQWAREAVYKYADELIAINHYSASIFPEKKATIVYDWIDMDARYEEQPLSKFFGEDMSDKRVYLYTGGVQRIKGAVEVISSFTKCIKEPNSRLLVVGVNPNGTESTFRQLLYKLGIKGYYIHLCELIKKDIRIVCIPPTYMLSHIMQQCYCNLSYFTIPHANLAMAECEIIGTPSIAADNEEAQEYSMNGALSLLFKANSKEDFAYALYIYDSKYSSLKDNLSKSSQTIKALFAKDTNINKLNKVINSVL